MESSPIIANRLSKAVILSVLFYCMTVIGFIFLAFVALNVPENMLIRSSKSSNLQGWLPVSSDYPADMILVDEYLATNKDVAESYPNSEDILQMLESWGRQEGYNKVYMSRDRCIDMGPRSISSGVILHKNSQGAQKYIEWLMVQDRAQATFYQSVNVGDYGYLYGNREESLCSDKESIIRIEVFFRQNNALGSVKISAVEGQNSPDAITNIALGLAQLIDRSIIANTSSQ